MDKEFYVEGLIPEVMSFVGDPKVWEQIIPNMKGFCVNEEKGFLHGRWADRLLWISADLGK